MENRRFEIIKKAVSEEETAFKNISLISIERKYIL